MFAPVGSPPAEAVLVDDLTFLYTISPAQLKVSAAGARFHS